MKFGTVEALLGLETVSRAVHLALHPSSAPKITNLFAINLSTYINLRHHPTKPQRKAEALENEVAKLRGRVKSAGRDVTTSKENTRTTTAQAKLNYQELQVRGWIYML